MTLQCAGYIVSDQCNITLHHYTFSKQFHSGLICPHELPPFSHVNINHTISYILLSCRNVCLNRSAGRSSPWSLPLTASISVGLSSHTDLVALSLRTCFPQSSIISYMVRLTASGLRLTLDPLPTAAEDVHFPTSLTSDGSNAIYLPGSSIFLGFAVGD